MSLEHLSRKTLERLARSPFAPPDIWCRIIGHDWTWDDGPQTSLLEAAVCRRCNLTHPKEKP